MSSFSTKVPIFSDLAGKVALVTGSSRGIGAETARYLAANAVKVIVAIAGTWPRGYERVCSDQLFCQTTTVNSRADKGPIARPSPARFTLSFFCAPPRPFQPGQESPSGNTRDAHIAPIPIPVSALRGSGRPDDEWLW